MGAQVQRDRYQSTYLGPIGEDEATPTPSDLTITMNKLFNMTEALPTPALDRLQHEWSLRESFRRGTINETGAKYWGELIATDSTILALQRTYILLPCYTLDTGPTNAIYTGSRIRRAFLWLNPRYLYTRDSIIIRDPPRVDTCDWVERNAQYRAFIESSDTGTLWIHGPPGSGKTTLAASIYTSCVMNAPKTAGESGVSIRERLGEVPVTDDGSQSQLEWDSLLEKDVSFVFVSVGDMSRERWNLEGVLAEIIIKLCADDSALMDAVLERMELSNNYIASYDELCSLLRLAGRKRCMMIIIDGIERLENNLWVNLIEVLNDWRDQAREGCVKLIITSTPIPQIYMRLKRDLEVEILPENTYGNMHRLIWNYVERIARHHAIEEWDDIKRDKIRRIFERGPQGNFLWRESFQEFLCHNISMLDLDRHVSSPPHTVDDVYRLVLSNLDALDPHWKALAIQTLALLLSARRLLDLEELLLLLALNADSSPPRFKKLLEQPKRVLISLLGPLIKFRTKIVVGGIGNTETRTVSLRHESAAEFLLANRPGVGFPLNLEECHLIAAKKCIGYLSLERFARTLPYKYPRGKGWQNRAEPQDLLLRYAVPHVWEHVVLAGEAGINSKDLYPLIENFLLSPQSLTWLDFLHYNTGADRTDFLKRLKLPCETLDDWHYGMGEDLSSLLRLQKPRERARVSVLLGRWRTDVLKALNVSFKESKLSLREIAVLRGTRGDGKCVFQVAAQKQIQVAPLVIRKGMGELGILPHARKLNFDYEEDSEDDEVGIVGGYGHSWGMENSAVCRVRGAEWSPELDARFGLEREENWEEVRQSLAVEEDKRTADCGSTTSHDSGVGAEMF